MSSAFPSADDVWFLISPKLPVPICYFPLVFRVLAVLLAAPFAVGVALDLIAYAIARTLHISPSSLRVARSPPRSAQDLSKEDDWDSSAFTSGLESRIPSPKKTSNPLPPVSSPSPVPRILQGFALTTLLLAIFLQWFSSANNSLNTQRLLGTSRQDTAPVALVLTAHPDDEVMFFAPTILNLVSSGWDIIALCMSEGNADGLGDVRVQELYESYRLLGVSSANVTLIDNPKLPDSMRVNWDPKLVAEIITPYVAQNGVTHLVTFDHTGVSSHPNHIALSKVYQHLSPRPRLLELRSPSILSKFAGPIYAAVVAARDLLNRPAVISSTAAKVTFISSPAQYLRSVRAMAAHKSQLVWFRYLYISFSHLMWVNQLDLIDGVSA